MRTFFKVFAMAVAVVGGSLRFLWLAFTDRLPLAWLTLVGMFLLTGVLIFFIARDTKHAPIKGGGDWIDDDPQPTRSTREPRRAAP